MDVVKTKLLRIEAGTRPAFTREHTGSAKGVQLSRREIAKMDTPDPADNRVGVSASHGMLLGVAILPKRSV